MISSPLFEIQGVDLKCLLDYCKSLYISWSWLAISATWFLHIQNIALLHIADQFSKSSTSDAQL
jgi:hypothetical protein